MIFGKVWGSTVDLFNKNGIEVKPIDVASGWRCSKHMHPMRHNLFYVSKGMLRIRVWKNDYDLVDTTLLMPGLATVVPAGEYHEFAALEPTLGVEIYWVELNDRDIVRENCGGRTKEDTTESK